MGERKYALSVIKFQLRFQILHFLACDTIFLISTSEWNLHYIQNRDNLYFHDSFQDLWGKYKKTRMVELVLLQIVAAHQKLVFFQSTQEL